jgi:hypothetical protein
VIVGIIYVSPKLFGGPSITVFGVNEAAVLAPQIVHGDAGQPECIWIIERAVLGEIDNIEEICSRATYFTVCSTFF